VLPPTCRKRISQIRATGTTALLTFSLAGLPEFPALEGQTTALGGRLLIAPSIDYLERAHDAAKYGDLSPQPSLEIAIPTVADPTASEAGRHVMSVYLQHAPAGTSAEAISATALATLEGHAPGIGALVTEQHVVTVDDLAQDWGFPGGHIFHADETLDQWWISRPLLGSADTYSTPIPGLFLASAGTHPGGGLTGQSGLNAARTVSVALGRRRR
jgi:phytoene dehydrogenase-like protein